MESQTLSSKIIKKLLTLFGKSYHPDPQIPAGLLWNEVTSRLFCLLRGILYFHKLVFLGRNVRIRGFSYIRIDSGSTIEDDVFIDAYSSSGIQIGARTRIGARTIIRSTAHLSVLGKGLKIGEDSGIGEYGYMGCAGGINIGDHVIIGQYASFHAQEHHFSDPEILIRNQGVSQKGIRIGSNTWIGARVTLLDGTEIGSGSVIAAGAVVKGKFPPDVILGGIPARVISTRIKKIG